MNASVQLGRRASFWVAAAVVVHTLWTSAAPAVTYPLYGLQWHLTPTVTTAMFAIYPVTVVLTLLIFGNLSDYLGRRIAILLGLAASTIGVLMFALAPSVGWIFFGRAFMGIGVGLSTSPATAAMVDYSAAGREHHASAIATGATALGLAMATLVGGGLIEYAPYPTHLNFWVLFVILVTLFCAAWRLPRQVVSALHERWRPRRIMIPQGIAREFFLSAVAVTASYAIGALVLSLGSQIARDLIGSANALVNGAAIALFAVVTGIVTIFAKRLPAPSSVLIGGLTMVVGMGLLVVSAASHALPSFIASIALLGAAYSLLFLGGLTVINQCAPDHHRAATLSAIYLIGYLLMGAIAMSIGVAATHWGLKSAIEYGAPAVALLGLLSTFLGAKASSARTFSGKTRRPADSE